MEEADQELVENWIDKHGLNAVLSELAVVCRLKSEHLESNWQDKNQAKLWRDKAQGIETQLSDNPIFNFDK